MTTHQFGPETDNKLHKASEDIDRAEEKILEATQEKDAVWEQVFNIFDEFGKEDKEGRFVASDGHYLYKQPVQPPAKLDEEKLLQLLQLRYPANWKSLLRNVSELRVSPALLEKAVQRGKIEAIIVDECLEVPAVRYNRIRKSWTKEDHERAVIFGLVKKGYLEK